MLLHLETLKFFRVINAVDIVRAKLSCFRIQDCSLKSFLYRLLLISNWVYHKPACLCKWDIPGHQCVFSQLTCALIDIMVYISYHRRVNSIFLHKYSLHCCSQTLDVLILQGKKREKQVIHHAKSFNSMDLTKHLKKWWRDLLLTTWMIYLLI